MNLLERAEAGQLSDYEISKLRQIIILYIQNDGPKAASDTGYQVLSPKSVANLTGLSRSAIEKRVLEGSFPQAVKLDERRIGWFLKDVLQCIKGINW